MIEVNNYYSTILDEKFSYVSPKIKNTGAKDGNGEHQNLFIWDGILIIWYKGLYMFSWYIYICYFIYL